MITVSVGVPSEPNLSIVLMWCTLPGGHGFSFQVVSSNIFSKLEPNMPLPCNNTVPSELCGLILGTLSVASY